MKIDSHHHFWRYSREEFSWVDDSMQRIRRHFPPTELSAELKQTGIDGVVTVQARQKIEETQWLLSLAAEHEFIKGVVGWLPLVDPQVRDPLRQFCEHKKLKAVRHVVQAEPDDRYLLRNDFNAGVAALAEFGLVYDILIFERHLPYAIEFVDRHPNQVFVLDHIAKPRIKEADYTLWTVEQLQPYWDTVLNAFGPRRMMFGSDWPVCLVACDYAHWYETVAELASPLTADEQARLFGATAREAYRL
jgi:L-fuconolactonase